MASAHTLPIGGHRVLQSGFRTIKDPGASGTFSFHSKDFVICEVVTAAAESRALPSAGGFPVGVKLRVVLVTDGGDLTITGASEVPVLQDANDTVEFIVTRSGSTKAWRVNSRSSAIRTVQLDFTQFRIHNAMQTLLGGTPAVDDIGLVATAFGTAAVLQSLTADEADDDNFARILWALPEDYVAGTNITVTSVVTEEEVAGAAATLDLEARRTSDISTELQAAAATSVAGGATVVQTITGAAILAGEVLDLRFNLAIDNTGGPGTVHYNIDSITVGYTGTSN